MFKVGDMVRFKSDLVVAFTNDEINKLVMEAVKNRTQFKVEEIVGDALNIKLDGQVFYTMESYLFEHNFRVGDIVKLKPGAVIDFKNFASPKSAEIFLRNSDYYVVSNILHDGKLGLTVRSSVFPTYFKPDDFEIYKKISNINEGEPASKLTKLEYAAIKIFAARDWDMSDKYRKNVIISAKKLLEECND